ncbi:MAG: methionine gamma-lyase family protein, partial [Oscillospiraceae bacterium]|nr:methionine gamma-lyase family protein [Oscillospiraceae bacterium]
MNDYFSFSSQVTELSQKALIDCGPAFERIDRICDENSRKVLAGFGLHRISEAHLNGSSGYGYADRGRDCLDALFATVLGAEDALVRHHFPCGTAAIATALFALLRPGDTMVSLTGRPYDTLHATLGLTGEKNIGSLAEFGVIYRELPLLPNGRVDLGGIADAVVG